MSGAFGPAASRLAGVAARALGWRPGEFWAATPAELAAALGWADRPVPVAAMDSRALRELMEQMPDGR